MTADSYLGNLQKSAVRNAKPKKLPYAKVQNPNRRQQDFRDFSAWRLKK